MATITITRPLASLTSAYNASSIDFTITAGSIPTCNVNGYIFSAVKTSTAGGLDYYTLILTDILKALIGDEPTTIDTNKLMKLVTVTILHSGSTSQETLTNVIYGYQQSLLTNLSSKLLAVGRTTDKLYLNNRNICFFWSRGYLNDVQLTIGGVYVGDVEVNYGYNYIYNGVDRSGLLAINGVNLFNVKYIGGEQGEKISWIDSDGCISEYLFTKKNSQSDIKDTEVDVFVTDHIYSKGDKRILSKNKTLTIELNTVCVDVDHFKQLQAISESKMVLYNGLLATKVKTPTKVADCRQNLSFTLTLELSQYVAGN